ncbi:MAG: sel1 repeat family protein [Oxalobacteraceae bacterium]|nr:sel1 repeat family protein [Oxalobacteraceae bacterium]
MIAFKEPTNLFTNSVTEITTQNTVQSSSEASASSSTPASPQQPPIIANRSKTPFPDIPLTHYYSAIFSVPDHQTQSSDPIKAELDKEWANIITLRTKVRSGSQVVKKNDYSEKNNFKTTTDISKQNEIKVSLQVNEKKSPEYFYNLGLAYSKGTGVDQNDTVAFSYFFQAAAQGHAKAQFYLALMYKRGQGVDQDFRKAAELYSKAAMQGGAYALFNLARMYQKGEGVDQDLRKAAELYTKAAMQGSADAQNNLARMYQNGEGVNQDLCKAADLYTKASAQGHAMAQYNLALMYDKGEGVDQDLPKAAELHSKAATQGHAGAQFNLALMYEKGEGVDQDLPKAADLFTKAAIQGYDKAQNNLAFMYEKGEVVNKDLRKAAEFYSKAANQGNAYAQYNLARMYQKGEGVNQDLRKAADLYTKASAQGHAKSQFYLALMYREGQGVDKDMSKAIELFVDAANAGHKESQFALSKIYFLGTGLKKDINVATLWLLRYGLSDDKKTITIAKNTDFELIQNIPDVLHTSPDFQDVTSLIFLTLPYQARGQVGALFAELIQCYPNLKRLEAPNYNITDAEALVIKSSLSSNTELRHLKINYTDLDRTTNVLNKLKIQASKKLPKIFGPDKSIKSQLLATVQQNKDLLELRNYLFKYLKAMDKNSSTRWFDEMPSDIVNIVANQFILTNLKNGYGKQASKDGLDEFLLSLQKNNLTMNTH